VTGVPEPTADAVRKTSASSAALRQDPPTRAILTHALSACHSVCPPPSRRA